MNAQILVKATEITQRFESNVLYSYFSDKSDRQWKGQTLSLSAIKQNLMGRKYLSLSDWSADISSYFEAVINDPDSSPIEKYAARIISDEIRSKVSFFESQMGVEQWKNAWCQRYQEVSQLIAKSPPKIPISKYSHPMQLQGIDIEISEVEIMQMKETIEQKFTDEQRDLLGKLVLALEPETSIQMGNEVVFDFAKVKKNTMLAIRKFIQNQMITDPEVQLFE
jgi:hypothetical protein